MTRQNKKQEETRLVEQMRSALGGVPAGQVEPADGPDVCITAGGHAIGVEVTELHQSPGVGNSLRRLQESERLGIVVKARALAEASGMPAVDVAVHFDDSASISKSDRKRLVIGLVNIVRSHLPNSEAPVTVELWRNPGAALPWIRTVRLFRAGFLTKHHWAVPAAGWVQMEFRAELQAVIDKKNLRHVQYSQRCDECWLLVVASGGRPSGLCLMPKRVSTSGLTRPRQ